MNNKTAEDRLMEKLAPANPATGCIEWTGAKGNYGYGLIWVDGKMIRTHRFAFQLKHGSIPEGMDVLHECDNPPCCNVDHLFTGTALDNAKDRTAKGRNNPVMGEEHPSSKLSDLDVMEIKRLIAKGENQKSIAKKFGVKQQAISKINTNQRWKHLK